MAGILPTRKIDIQGENMKISNLFLSALMFATVFVSNGASAQIPTIGGMDITAPPWNCREEFVDWMGAGGGYFMMTCDSWDFSPPPPPEGGGGYVSAAEAQRVATCNAAKAEWADKKCDERRIASRPSSNQDINFAFLGYPSDAMRGSVLALHQALWDDTAGNVWNNYNDYILRMYQVCESLGSAINSGICRLNVDRYFGQFFDTGFAAWQNSPAAADAYSSRYGQVCVNLAAVRAQNQCN
jgi:hypothetical protein